MRRVEGIGDGLVVISCEGGEWGGSSGERYGVRSEGGRKGVGRYKRG